MPIPSPRGDPAQHRRGRCIFSNHCLRIQLLGVPQGCALSNWFAGCSGLLMISHGSARLRTATDDHVLNEGDAISLPLEANTELWPEKPEKGADVLYFARREAEAAPSYASLIAAAAPLFLTETRGLCDRLMVRFIR